MNKVENFRNKMYKHLAYIGAFFLVLAISTSFLGKFIDNKFNIAPYGTMGSMFLGLILSWTLIIIYYTKVVKPDINKSKKFDKEINGK